MIKIAYILLCHKNPSEVERQARTLTSAGDYVVIHYDARSGRAGPDALKKALGENANVAFASRRMKCGWGEWSLVQATLNALKTAVNSFPDATHFYLMSGDCAPIKPARYIRDYLADNDVDFIESVDFFTGNWIKTGFRDDRVRYRHYFNERTQKRLFYGAYNLQKSLGLRRDPPRDIELRIGSQWWCLRRSTVDWILTFLSERPDISRFFRTTWIPDETFFQTLVYHGVPRDQIRARTLTFSMFTDYGLPVTFYNDHGDLLTSQDFLFARKISPEATELRAQLDDLYRAQDAQISITGQARNLYGFLTGQGRVGRRFGRRFWEADDLSGQDRQLLIIACKKWHLAKALAQQLAQAADVPALQYLFNEEDAGLPDLGGAGSTLAKRTRHRRALIRLLFDHYESQRMIICVDPADFDFLADFCGGKSDAKVLEMRCEFSDDYLKGHAVRTGLARDESAEETFCRLLPVIRNKLEYEAERINAQDFANHYVIREGDAAERNANQLAAFLDIPAQMAHDICKTNPPFDDKG